MRMGLPYGALSPTAVAAMVVRPRPCLDGATTTTLAFHGTAIAYSPFISNTIYQFLEEPPSGAPTPPSGEDAAPLWGPTAHSCSGGGSEATALALKVAGNSGILTRNARVLLHGWRLVRREPCPVSLQVLVTDSLTCSN
ncbi:hypothetical protein Sjap_026036 [Stephania japonica]|uniref:Uncharacterized protein n=1 Tax=Stephania japonica TaxID=461633 RepID=A0AAP0E5C5_9MAGN